MLLIGYNPIQNKKLKTIGYKKKLKLKISFQILIGITLNVKINWLAFTC